MKKCWLIRAAAVLLGLWLSPGYAETLVAREILLSSQGSPVYSGGSHKEPLAQVECIFSHLQQPVSVQRLPWRRAHEDLLKGVLDGYFTAKPMVGPERQGVLSEPLLLENWYWFWRADREPIDLGRQPQPRLGAILGSHQASLLNEQGYTLHAQVNSLPQLLKLLMSGRIDGLLADKEYFEEAAAELGIGSSQYHYRFFRYVPLGVYFSKSFLEQQPEFLAQFNRTIYRCAPEGFALSDYERGKVEQQILPMIEAWRNLPRLQAAVIEQNRRHKDISPTDILAWDSLWMDEFHYGPPRFSLAVLNNPLSQELRVLKYVTDGLVTEIIVTDEHGLNVGVSDMTSDYWQGNEAKYQQTIGYPPEHVFVDVVAYDESTRRFQVQVSVPLYSQGRAKAIGVMTVGVDIEKVLAREWQ